MPVLTDELRDALVKSISEAISQARRDLEIDFKIAGIQVGKK